MKKYLFIIIAIFIISSNLEAQCKRGEQLRITNDVEIKVVDKLKNKEQEEPQNSS